MNSNKKHYNHKERKQIEKNLGLKKPENKELLAEYKIRRMTAGKVIHTQYIENMINEQEKADAKKEKDMINDLMRDVCDKNGNIIRKGKSYEEAKAMILRNYEIEQKRLKKLADKNIRRMTK